MTIWIKKEENGPHKNNPHSPIMNLTMVDIWLLILLIYIFIPFILVVLLCVCYSIPWGQRVAMVVEQREPLMMSGRGCGGYGGYGGGSEDADNADTQEYFV